MTAWMLGAFIEDRYLHLTRLPQEGESLNVRRVHRSPGGKAANQAVAAARLGATACLIAAVGDDSAGREGLAALQSNGVRTSDVAIVDSATDESIVLLTDDAQQLILNVAGASSELAESHVIKCLDSVAPGDILSVQGEISPVVTCAAIRAVADRARVILNPSPVEGFLDGPDVWWGVDIVVVNESEANELLGDVSNVPTGNDLAAAVANRTGVQNVVVTLGPRGALLHTPLGAERIPAPSVRAVDPTGAGDGFTAALTYGLQQRATLADACRLAVAVGAHAVEHNACLPGYPTLDQLRQWSTDRDWQLPATFA